MTYLEVTFEKTRIELKSGLEKGLPLYKRLLTIIVRDLVPNEGKNQCIPVCYTSLAAATVIPTSLECCSDK
jgi:hypothetical protein